MKKLRAIVLSAFAVAFIGTLGVPAATTYADNGIAYIGGGSGIQFGTDPVLDANPVTNPPAGTRICTLTAIGYDQFDNLVGISVGHCPVNTEAAGVQNPNSVIAQGDPDAGVIGTVVTKVYEGTKLTNSANKDYSVIQFNKSKVVPLQTVGSTTMYGIATSSPSLFSNICKEGRTTAQTCGIVTSTNSSYFQSYASATGGDSGGPAINPSNGNLLGYVQGPGSSSFTTSFVSIQPVLSAINANNGVGKGFHLDF